MNVTFTDEELTRIRRAYNIEEKNTGFQIKTNEYQSGSSGSSVLTTRYSLSNSYSNLSEPLSASWLTSGLVLNIQLRSTRMNVTFTDEELTRIRRAYNIEEKNTGFQIKTNEFSNWDITHELSTSSLKHGWYACLTRLVKSLKVSSVIFIVLLLIYAKSGTRKPRINGVGWR
jgi:hypothetical protein